jgi:hypothetical protein
MTRRRRRLSHLSRILGVTAALAASALIGPGPSIGTAAPGAPASPHKDIPYETFLGGITPEEEAAQQASLHGWLMQEMPAGVLDEAITVRLTNDERSDLRKRQEAKGGPAVVGRTKPVAAAVRFSNLDAALLSDVPRRAGNGVLRATPDGGFVWAAAIRSEGAGALRVRVSGLDLPGDADMFFFSPEGQAFGPYSGRGPNEDGDFWTNTVFGSQGVVLLRHYGPDGAGDLKRISFVISEAGHIDPGFSGRLRAVTESFCSFNVSCIENASCFSGTPAQPAKSAVALMQWISGAFIFTCTGGLLADTVTTSDIPYFLTANHCLSSNNNASNLETYFQFSISCGSTNCPAQTQPGGIQRLGATVKATGGSGDFTLLQLNQTPPSGSVFLGSTNAPVANTNNAVLHRISHPAWAPQAYSRQHVDTSAPTCSGWPRGERIYSRTEVGGTEGGSSGSPVVNDSSQVVGQLSGACGFNVDDDCDHVNNATVDGALAHYWTSVQPFLAPSGGCTPVAEVCNDAIDNDCDGSVDCADSNCTGSPSCVCSPNGTTCIDNSDCCSNKCRGPAGRKVCR